MSFHPTAYCKVGGATTTTRFRLRTVRSARALGKAAGLPDVTRSDDPVNGTLREALAALRYKNEVVLPKLVEQEARSYERFWRKEAKRGPKEAKQARRALAMRNIKL